MGRAKRFAVFGGRDYPHRDRVWAALNALLAKHGVFTLVHGACPTGADLYAAEWNDWQAEGGGHWPVEPCPAKWRELGRAAGPRRNHAMATSGLDGAVQFPGGRGTANMRLACDNAGVVVWEPDNQA